MVLYDKRQIRTEGQKATTKREATSATNSSHIIDYTNLDYCHTADSLHSLVLILLLIYTVFFCLSIAVYYIYIIQLPVHWVHSAQTNAV